MQPFSRFVGWTSGDSVGVNYQRSECARLLRMWSIEGACKNRGPYTGICKVTCIDTCSLNHLMALQNPSPVHAITLFPIVITLSITITLFPIAITPLQYKPLSTAMLKKKWSSVHAYPERGWCDVWYSANTGSSCVFGCRPVIHSVPNHQIVLRDSAATPWPLRMWRERDWPGRRFQTYATSASVTSHGQPGKKEQIWGMPDLGPIASHKGWFPLTLNLVKTHNWGKSEYQVGADNIYGTSI